MTDLSQSVRTSIEKANAVTLKVPKSAFDELLGLSLPDSATQKDTRQIVQRILGVLQNAATCALLAFALPALGIDPSTAWEDVPPQNKVKAIVEQFAPVKTLEPSTNYTDGVIGAFAATGIAFRASSYGTPTRWTDATGCVWEVTFDNATWMDEDKALVHESDELGTRWMWGGVDTLEYSNGTWSYGCGHRTASFVATAPEDATVLVMHDISSDPPLADVTLVRPQLTNLVGRVAHTDEIPEWPIKLVTTNSPILFADGADTNVPSVAIYAGPTNYSSMSFMTPVSWYLPNRFSLLELGHDYQIAAAQWFQVGRFLYAPSPDRIVFFGGERHKTLQEYLDACSPETMGDLLSAYVPTNGGGRIHGDLEIDGQLTAGSLVTITNSDIIAKGFSVIDKVLTADGLYASNGMVRLHCARFMLGFGTPRIHVETNDLGSAFTYGGTWEHPAGNLGSYYEDKIEQVLDGDNTNQNIEARNPYVKYGDVKRYFAGWALEDHAVNNGPWKHYDLSNYRTHYFTDSNVGSSGIELNFQSNAHVRIVYDFTETAPNVVSFNWGYDGPATIISNGSQLASPTPGTCTLIEIEHLSGTRYLVTEHEMSTTYTTTSRWDEEEEP